MVLILIAGINALLFTAGSHRRLAAHPSSGVGSEAGPEAGGLLKMSAALSLALWFGTILLGRLIVAFQGSSGF